MPLPRVPLTNASWVRLERVLGHATVVAEQRASDGTGGTGGANAGAGASAGANADEGEGAGAGAVRVRGGCGCGCGCAGAATVRFRNTRARFKTHPKVQMYCLMSVAGSYTDFHVDFGGTSVW